METSIEFSVDLEKLNTVRYYLSKKGIDLEEELAGFLDTLYKKYVPQQVRDFVEDEKPYSSATVEETSDQPEKRPYKRVKHPGGSVPADEQ